jgi:hypothetical protein
MTSPDDLRELAAWYREYAERAGNPAIWHSRLMTALKLEEKAAHLAATKVRAAAPEIRSQP